MRVQHFFDPRTFTLTYVVHDRATGDAVIVDPVLDYEPGASKTFTESVDAVTAYVKEHRLRARAVLETHAHADHLTGSRVLAKRLGTETFIGARIVAVQRIFRDLFDLELPTDGRQFDRLLRDGEVFSLGALSVRVVPTPGHTPACVSYVMGDAVFTGDALFVEDYGTGRADFPGGSADELYTSVHDRLYALPEETRVFPCHDYLPNGRPLRFETTIGASKRSNVQLREETTRADYVAMRRARDATLAAPRLLLPSVQVNVAGGMLPKKHPNGRRYLSIPIEGPPELEEAGAR